MSEHLTPALNHLAVSVAAPAVLLADPDGQVRRGGVRGWLVDDVRLLDTLVVTVAGSDLDLVRAAVVGAARQEYTYAARGLGGWRHDPTVTVDRVRTLTGSGLSERLTLASRAAEPVEVTLHVEVGGDLAPTGQVRQGLATEQVPPAPTGDGLRWRRDDRGFVMACDPPPTDRSGSVLTWRFTLPPGERTRVALDFTALDFTARGEPALGPGGPPPWASDAAVEAPDRRLPRLAQQSLADLGGLLMRDGDDAFVGAGSPWFLTLFGRDSLWTARLLMPFGTGLALSTLRVLARRQGTRTDLGSEEQPGKIPHEVRGSPLQIGGMWLPPVYYGTVDATALFVCTLVDAWRWGAERDRVAALLPAARRALGWLLAQSAESGWLRYVDSTGRGLANQGWKDSRDSVQFADGRLAEPPIALSEVQAYAYEAVTRGAELLAAFGEPAVTGLAAWADDLRDRFRDRFWVETAAGGHVAIALDGSGRPVDSVTSNMGHLLGTGILDEAQAARVVRVLTGPELSSGFGLRTLTSASPRYSRLSYHGGSVWPHDTAIAVRGLAADGYVHGAALLTAGIVAAAEGVGYRLPELYGGDPADGPDGVSRPCDYPAACRPQAWAAAAPLAALVAVTGLVVDVPAGTVRVPERVSARLGAFTVRGIRAGGTPLTVRVAADGAVTLD